MKVIGRTDKIDLPEFGLFDIDAKIDTGAYGCALHCYRVEVVEYQDQRALAFRLLDPKHDEFENKTYYAFNFRSKTVKSSSGEVEHRYTVKTVVVLFGKKYKVEFSLTDRSTMKFPILIGSKFLSKKFVVDVQKKNLSFSQKMIK